MARPPAAGLVSGQGGAPAVRVGATAEIAPDVLASARTMLVEAFAGDLDPTDWDHALGGVHAWIAEGARVVAHAALVPRTLWSGTGRLRAGYVEALGTAADRRRRGLGSAVMAALEERAPTYDVLALSSTGSGLPLYRHRGWTPWRGPTGVRTASGGRRTPADDGGVLVMAGRIALERLDLDGPLWCDHREGDVW